LADAAYHDKALSISQFNRIIKAVKEGKNTPDQHHSRVKKTKRTGDIVACVAVATEKNWGVMV
jgi:hypothetical protein